MMSSYGSGIHTNSYGSKIYSAAMMGETPLPLRYAVPASETPEGKERERAYYDALGRFVQIFAEVEKVAAETLWYYAKTKPEIAKIVFSGVKIDLGWRFTKQLAAAIGAPQEAKDDLENVFQQLAIITGVRNDILHYGATAIAEGCATVSNAWKARAEPTTFPITPKALLDMRDDLRKIIAHLGYRHLGRPWPKSSLDDVILREALQRAWQYKHPVPPKSQTKTEQPRPAHKRGPKPPRQRKASPA